MTQVDLFESGSRAARRKAEAERQRQLAEDAQFFETEPRIARALFEHGHDLHGGVDGLPGGRWCEPGAGTGVLTAEAVELDRVRAVDAFELRPVAVEAARRRLAHLSRPGKRVTVRTMDWLLDGADFDIGDPGERLDALPPLPDRYSVAFMNPPYSGGDRGRDVAAEFLRATFARCPGAWVWALLRTQWVIPRGAREDWLTRRVPRYALILAGDRAGFRTHGSSGPTGTDSAEYGWFAWAPGDRLNEPRNGKIDLSGWQMVIAEPRPGSRRDRARERSDIAALSGSAEKK